MRPTPLMFAGLLAVLPMATALAADGTGLAVSSDPVAWSHWQGRISVGSLAPALASEPAGADGVAQRVASLSLMGDYYFSNTVRLGTNGGFRASGGVVYGPGTVWAGRPMLGTARLPLRFDRRWAAGLPGDAGADAATVPYLGLGYTGLSGTGRFGFSADLGLVARSPGQAVKLGRVLGGLQNLDDVVRDLRLAPVLQIGVSYAF